MITEETKEQITSHVKRLQHRYRENLVKKYNIELYKYIEGYEGLYQITNHGRVWSVKSRAFLKLRSSKNKRLRVSLQKEGKSKECLVHRLVLFAFKGSPNKDEECRHLDGNPRNNHIDNLEWGTSLENYKDRIKHGTGNEGENHGQTHLTEEDVKNIRQLRKNGYKYISIAEQYKIGTSQVYRIVNKESWKHVD